METAVKEFLQPHLHLLQDTSNLSVVLAISLIIIGYIYYRISTKGLPPGPTGFPVLGLWPFLKDDTCHLQLYEYQKKYGDLFSFNYAGILYINMGSIHATRELHVTKADCFERVSVYSYMCSLFENGVVFLNGEAWKTQRKFALQQFRELGMNTVKESMSGQMYESIKETIAFLKSQNGKPVDIIQMLTNECNALLRRTLFRDQGITEQEVREINESYGEVVTFMTPINNLLGGTLAKYFLLPYKSGYKNCIKHHKNMQRILYEIIERHKANFSEEHSGNYIDAFLNERNKRKARGDPTADHFTDKILAGNLHQFVGDGVLGVAVFLSSFFKYVVDHADEQEKIYSELVEVVGSDRDPSIEDKSKLNYTNALILEIFRTSDFFTLFASQQCIKECTVRGHRIPKGAVTLMNFWGCHINPDVYEEPEKFNPLRFLPQNGKERPELPVTFGVGKRACIGEGYATAQVFLFLTSIIKHFKLTIPKNDKSVFDIIMSHKMEICFEERK